MTRCALIAAVAGVLLYAPWASAQGKLRQAHRAIHPLPIPAVPQFPIANDDSGWLGVDSSYLAPAQTAIGLGAAGLGAIGVVIVTSPFWGPHEFFDAGFDQRGWFPPYPHALDDRPYMVIGNCTDEVTVADDYFDPHCVKPWALRMSVDAGDDFDRLARFGGQFFLDSSIHRLGLLVNMNYYRETLLHGGTDEALMADYNLTWRVTQSPSVQMHLGAGLRTWMFDGQTDPGLNFLYRADVFPVNQLHVSTLIEVSRLRDAFIFHGQIQAGFTFRHGEIFVGYDFLRIETINLQGPSAGIRLWF